MALMAKTSEVETSGTDYPVNARVMMADIPTWFPVGFNRDVVQLDQLVAWFLYIRHRMSKVALMNEMGRSRKTWIFRRRGTGYRAQEALRQHCWDLASVILQALGIKGWDIKAITEELVSLASLPLEDGGGRWREFADELRLAWIEAAQGDSEEVVEQEDDE